MSKLYILLFLFVFPYAVVGQDTIEHLRSVYSVDIWDSEGGGYDIRISDLDAKIDIKKHPNKKYFDDEAFAKLMRYKDKIKSLSIDSKYISRESILKISDCINMIKISLGNNYDDECSSIFSQMHKLEKVQLGNRKNISKVTLEALSKNTPLKYLEVSCQSLKDDDIEGLSGMPAIEYIHLNNTSITDKGIEILSSQNHPKLTVLDVNETNITDKAIPFFIKMKGLENLQVHNTRISPEGVKQLEKAMPKCQIVAGEY